MKKLLRECIIQNGIKDPVINVINAPIPQNINTTYPAISLPGYAVLCQKYANSPPTINAPYVNIRFVFCFC